MHRVFWKEEVKTNVAYELFFCPHMYSLCSRLGTNATFRGLHNFPIKPPEWNQKSSNRRKVVELRANPRCWTYALIIPIFQVSAAHTFTAVSEATHPRELSIVSIFPQPFFLGVKQHTCPKT
jgi:hypothetical protein